MLKIALIVTVALLAKVAFAFDIPDWVKPQSEPPSVTGSFQFSGGPGRCADKAAAISFIKSRRQAGRQEYAEWVGKFMPSLTPGASCIRAKDGIGAAKDAVEAVYKPNGDYFEVTCIAETRGRLSHVFKMEILSQPNECWSDARIAAHVNPIECLSKPDIDSFLKPPCGHVGAIPPKLYKNSKGNVAVPVDPAFFAHLMNKSPQILNVVDKDRRVKVGSSRGGSSSGSEGEDCKAGVICWPGSGGKGRSAE